MGFARRIFSSAFCYLLSDFIPGNFLFLMPLLFPRFLSIHLQEKLAFLVTKNGRQNEKRAMGNG